jgi:hypothetical protein
LQILQSLRGEDGKKCTPLFRSRATSSGSGGGAGASNARLAIDMSSGSTSRRAIAG